MKIVSSILPPESLINEINRAFPKQHFEFYKGMKAAEKSFLDADVFLTFGEDLTDSSIKRASKLKWIMVMSAGMEKMPFKACREKGIIVTNARGIHKVPMAEFTLSQMLQHVKQTKTLAKNENNQNWDRKIQMGELSGKTILILGVGAIGGEIARLSKAFNMRTMGLNTSGKAVEFIDSIHTMNQLDKALPEADFIVSVLPSTAETKNILTERHFILMKPSAVFINIGRGDLVKESVLVNALRNQEISHAFLDVFSEEPLKEGHPLWGMENATVTPHISSITERYLPRAFEIFTENLHKYRKNTGNYINQINLEREY